jgi:hypothetical protein
MATKKKQAEKKAKAPRRQYMTAEGTKLPSVTTILGAAVAKPGLISWAARVAAEATAEAILDGFCDRDVAIAEGTKAPNSRRDGAADLGTRAHALVEAHYAGEDVQVEGLDVDVLMDCYHRAVRAISERWTVEQSEWGGVSALGYGGTLDLLVIDNETQKRLLVDLKTGSYHPEAIAQLAAYRQLWQEHNPDKLIDGGAILHVPVKGDTATVIGISSESLDAGWNLFEAAKIVHGTLPKLVFDEPR